MKNKKSIIPVLTSAILLTASTASLAQESPVTVSEEDRVRHESAGIIGGALIGGALGGPIGAIATAVFGGWISDKTLAQKENGLLTTALDESRQDLVALQAEYRALEARYEVAKTETQQPRFRNTRFDAKSRPDASSSCCEDAEISLHFKTGSTAIENLYLDKLGGFVALSRKNPDAVIEITGHADRRGGSTANLALSRSRIKAVEESLISLGLNSRAFQTSAFGESQPLSRTDSLEDNFFDRRVVLKLVTPDSEYLTRNND